MLAWSSLLCHRHCSSLTDNRQVTLWFESSIISILYTIRCKTQEERLNCVLNIFEILFATRTKVIRHNMVYNFGAVYHKDTKVLASCEFENYFIICCKTISNSLVDKQNNMQK